nr:AGE family epimerase/isomerase [Planosporangium flavigriseum]
MPEGGFGWLDVNGAVDPSLPRPLYANARMTYVFALAHLLGVPDTVQLSESGVRAMMTEYADAEHGGWFTSLDFHGTIIDATKMSYAHAHVLLAGASAVVAGVPGAQDAFAAVTDVIEKRFWSDEEGCALESWSPDFTELEPYRGANSNMHSLEAYLVAADASGNAVWRERALSIATKIVNGHARAHEWRVPEHYDESWRPILDYNSDRRDDQFRPYGATPGHSFEWARLLLNLEAALPAAPPWMLEAATGLFDVAVADGWRPDGRPGIVYTVDMDGTPVVTRRLHWVMCEAVLAADALHRRTGDARFAELGARWWDEIERFYVDRIGGSWWHELSTDLQPASSTWSGKADVYHIFQSVLFPSLPLAPTAATALKQRGAR